MKINTNKNQDEGIQSNDVRHKVLLHSNTVADQGVLNPDAHMFIQEDFYQAVPDVVATIMMQLSLKSGLKEWGDKPYKAVSLEME
jgi:hypothetical protein